LLPVLQVTVCLPKRVVFAVPKRCFLQLRVRAVLDDEGEDDELLPVAPWVWWVMGDWWWVTFDVW